MPARWILFRIVCILQMLGAAVFMIMGMINFFTGMAISGILSIVLFLAIFLLTILAVNILNNNYPNVPVSGRQKTNFNRLFLINFLFLVFLFALIFAEYRGLNEIAKLLNRPLFDLPFNMVVFIIAVTMMLIFQLIILYGLYQLRRELYINFTRKEFDFEKD